MRGWHWPGACRRCTPRIGPPMRSAVPLRRAALGAGGRLGASCHRATIRGRTGPQWASQQPARIGLSACDRRAGGRRPWQAPKAPNPKRGCGRKHVQAHISMRARPHALTRAQACMHMHASHRFCTSGCARICKAVRELRALRRLPIDHFAASARRGRRLEVLPLGRSHASPLRPVPLSLVGEAGLALEGGAESS